MYFWMFKLIVFSWLESPVKPSELFTHRLKVTGPLHINIFVNGSKVICASVSSVKMSETS